MHVCKKWHCSSIVIFGRFPSCSVKSCSCFTDLFQRSWSQWRQYILCPQGPTFYMYIVKVDEVHPYKSCTWCSTASGKYSTCHVQYFLILLHRSMVSLFTIKKQVTVYFKNHNLTNIIMRLYRKEHIDELFPFWKCINSNIYHIINPLFLAKIYSIWTRCHNNKRFDSTNGLINYEILLKSLRKWIFWEWI